MKFKRAAGIAVSCVFLAGSFVAFTGCGGGTGDKAKGSRVEIKFFCDAYNVDQGAWKNLIAAYNDGAGMEDNVFVSPTLQRGVSVAPSASYFTSGGNYAYNVMALSDSANSFQSIVMRSDSRRAPDGYLLNLDSYAAADEDFQANDIPETTMRWWKVKLDKNASQGAGKPKHIVGEGNLYGVPIGSSAHLTAYNRELFEEQKINIISVEESALDGTGTYAKVQPHGYAEYKESPFEGAVRSKTLDGRDVYKVFNNRIGMNWEEQRNFFKYFTKEYNASSASDWAFVSEFWFSYGWSVGGDAMGYDGREYDFTLLDKDVNYLVTKDNTLVNGVTYRAGDIVRYEDRVNQADIASLDGLYPIKSQYDAIREYVALQKPTDGLVDAGYSGYGVASPDTTNVHALYQGDQVAMIRTTPSEINALLQEGKANRETTDFCPAETYREYDGGSTYQKDGKAGFANEQLLVIGEKYDLDGDGQADDVYTGELKKVDGTPVVGKTTAASITQALVIPACSNPEKYQAAWDFISWAATEGQRYIALTDTLAPVSQKVLFSEHYAYNQELSRGKNFYAVAMASTDIGRGDWGYFEDGGWVTDWANDFNNHVRRGDMTLSAFYAANGAKAIKALNDMYCVIKGIR